MKAKYLKPIIEVEPLMDNLMISASILGETGNTSIDGITSGDAREFEFSEWEEDQVFE